MREYCLKEGSLRTVTAGCEFAVRLIEWPLQLWLLLAVDQMQGALPPTAWAMRHRVAMPMPLKACGIACRVWLGYPLWPMTRARPLLKTAALPAITLA